MHELDDNALLREYAAGNSESAFAALVTRHINKVYSVALRHTNNPHQAEEITQAVFVILARKANELARHPVPSGWLYQTARLTAVTFLRGEIRRTRREQEACMQTVSEEIEPNLWPQLAPLLDSAMAGLGDKDRCAIVLRFFDGKSMKEIGDALGNSEDAAKVRVNRAVEKLRAYFSKRGVNSTADTIANSISANSIQAAPAALIKTTTAVALAKGATASLSTATLIKGALKIMAWTKTQTVIVAGAVVLLAAGTVIVTSEQIHKHNTFQWQIETNVMVKVLEAAPPMVEIRPTKFTMPRATAIHFYSSSNVERLAFDTSVEQMIFDAYGSRPTRSILPKLPQEQYDYIVSFPSNSSQALADEIKRKFGFVGRKELVETNVLLLKLSDSDTSAFKPAKSLVQSMNITNASQTELSAGFDRDDAHFNRTMSALIWQNSLEDVLHVPIVDETGITDRFDYVFHYPQPDSSWRKRPNAAEQALKDALHQQLGLELVPTNMPIEMLVVEKAK